MFPVSLSSYRSKDYQLFRVHPNARASTFPKIPVQLQDVLRSFSPETTTVTYNVLVRFRSTSILIERIVYLQRV